MWRAAKDDKAKRLALAHLQYPLLANPKSAGMGEVVREKLAAFLKANPNVKQGYTVAQLFRDIATQENPVQAGVVFDSCMAQAERVGAK